MDTSRDQQWKLQTNSHKHVKEKKPPMRGTKTPLIAASNNSIKTNYIEKRINKTQQHKQCRLYSDKYEMVNQISKWSKLT